MLALRQMGARSTAHDRDLPETLHIALLLMLALDSVSEPQNYGSSAS